jgi:hypothetical protein
MGLKIVMSFLFFFSSMLAMLAAADQASGLKFGPKSVTVDTDVLIVNRPAKYIFVI